MLAFLVTNRWYEGVVTAPAPPIIGSCADCATPIFWRGVPAPDKLIVCGDCALRRVRTARRQCVGRRARRAARA